MNEIEKMYKLANIQPQYKKRIECKEGYSVGQPCGKSPCIDCDKSVFEYVMPPFTAEKQIELIKWLVHYIKQINITDAISGEFYFTAFGCVGNMKIDFEEALASLVNKLWQNLTGEEKQQIKETLE